MSSPIWFEWLSPGTFSAMFIWWVSSIQTLLLHFAFFFLLFMQELSVKTLIFSFVRSIPCWRWWDARFIDIWSGFVKTQKHSSMPSLQVIVELNIIPLSITHAVAFLAFLFIVSESVLWFSFTNRLYLGARSFSLVSASTAHTWGFLHPFCRSHTHLMHMHAWAGECVLSLASLLVSLLS